MLFHFIGTEYMNVGKNVIGNLLSNLNIHT